MVVAADHHHPIPQEGCAHELGMMRSADVDAELRLAPQHRLGHAGRRVIEDLDAIPRIPGRVLLDDVRQILDADRRHARDRDVARVALRRSCGAP
jgi:hypothetical protein